MKKIFLLGGVLAVITLIGASCPSNGAPNVTPPTTTPPTTSSATQTYKNGTYGFEFQYPVNMVFVTPNYTLLQDKILELQIPGNDYPDTNFGDAAISVSASFAPSTSSCLALDLPISNGFKVQRDINGVTFNVATSTEAAAGNLYDSTIYRALVGGQLCVELKETIHTGNIANYPSGTVSEVNKKVVQNQLDSILNTFKFTGM